MSRNTIDPSMFPTEELQKDLEGETVRRVSRATIVKALKAQTSTISALFQDAVEKGKMIEELQESNRTLKNQVAELQSGFTSLQEIVRKQGETLAEHEEILGSGKIEKLFERVDDLEMKMSETEEQISNGFQAAADDRQEIRADAKKNFDQVREDIKKFDELTQVLDSRASKLEDRMKDIGYKCKDGVWRVRASRVAVGASELPITDLLDNLKATLNQRVEGLQIEIGEHKDMLENFAPKVKLIPEAHETAMANKKLFEDLGFGEEGDEAGILEQFADMKDDMSDIKNALLDKCDISKMHETIELKYDEIVDHLQEAISAAVEDEDEFKKATEDLKEMCKNLMMNKADKMALVELNERLSMNKLIKEEILTIKGEIGEKIGRKEVGQMLTEHDKHDQKQMMEVVTSMAKRMDRHIAKRLADIEAQNPALGGNYGRSGVSNNSNVPPLTATGTPLQKKSGKMKRVATIISGPVMGPGGPTLGGGFSVRLPQRANTSKGRRLPKLDSGSLP